MIQEIVSAGIHTYLIKSPSNPNRRGSVRYLPLHIVDAVAGVCLELETTLQDTCFFRYGAETAINVPFNELTID